MIVTWLICGRCWVRDGRPWAAIWPHLSPYDLCTELIARELGVVVTGPDGGPLRARLAVEPDVSWAGYANQKFAVVIELCCKPALNKRGLLEASSKR